jgi:hypothetical protein
MLLTRLPALIDDRLPDGVIFFNGSLEEPPEMNKTLWALPLVVKLVEILHRKCDNTSISDDMQKNSDFLSGPISRSGSAAACLGS